MTCFRVPPLHCLLCHRVKQESVALLCWKCERRELEEVAEAIRALQT